MIKKWENTKIDIGIVKPQQKVSITFKCLEPLKDVYNITTSCGCSKGHISGDTVVVSFTPGSIPLHLAKAGVNSHKTSKTVKVHYEDGQTDILQFTGTIKR